MKVTDLTIEKYSSSKSREITVKEKNTLAKYEINVMPNSYIFGYMTEVEVDDHTGLYLCYKYPKMSYSKITDNNASYANGIICKIERAFYDEFRQKTHLRDFEKLDLIDFILATYIAKNTFRKLDFLKDSSDALGVKLSYDNNTDKVKELLELYKEADFKLDKIDKSMLEKLKIKFEV